MKNRITDQIVYAGVNDYDVDLFEGQYEVLQGMAYNSYVILDEKTAVMDTVDQSKTDEWLGSVKEALAGRKPDYLIIHHMEPDHSASLKAFLQEFPETTVVGNAKTFAMAGQFFPGLVIDQKKTVKDGDSLELGNHTLTFIFAPMVHWPEVMMSYESEEKILFSADAFGTFGAVKENSGEKPDSAQETQWADEARRYYIGIVGKYGAQVQNVLKKLAKYEVNAICPLHGPVLRDHLSSYINLYDIWSSYRPETSGVCVCYTSVYGHTKEAAELLCDCLAQAGAPAAACHDLARCDMAEAVADAFRCEKLVLATTTYNGDIFPAMRRFLESLTERNFQNRTVAFIENGTWAPMAAKVMKAILETSKNLTYTEHDIVIKSAMTQENRRQIAALAESLA